MKRFLLIFVLAFALVLSFCVPALGYSDPDYIEYVDQFVAYSGVTTIYKVSRSAALYELWYIDEETETWVGPTNYEWDDLYGTIANDQDFYIEFFTADEWASFVDSLLVGESTDIKVEFKFTIQLLYQTLSDSASAPFDASDFYLDRYSCDIAFECPDWSNYCDYSSGCTFSGPFPLGVNNLINAQGASDSFTLSANCVYDDDAPDYDIIKRNTYYTSSAVIRSLYSDWTVWADDMNPDDEGVYDRMGGIPSVSFLFANVYKYLPGSGGSVTDPVDPPESSEPVSGDVTTVDPWNEVHEPEVSVDYKQDQFGDFVDSQLDKASDAASEILNLAPWIKYRTALTAVGGLFRALVDGVPLFSDLANFWTYFALFNMLLGAFIVGVRTWVNNRRADERRKSWQEYKSMRSQSNNHSKKDE